MSLLLPGTDAYEAVRRPPLGLYHHVRPQVIARCTTAGDVAEAIASARRGGLELAVRSGGHCFAGRSSTEGMLIDVAPINGVVVGDGVATIGAGARLGDVYDALEPHGVAIAAGCGPTVGIAGLVLGGGLGILGRKHGLTCDQLVAARVVLADGRVVDCDEQRHADLFWALRGAGGCQFGVVTELTLRTVPAPTTTTLHLQWPYEHAVAIADSWQAWAPEAPDELAASLLVTAGPDPAAPAASSTSSAPCSELARRRRPCWSPSPPSRRRPTSMSSPTGRPSAGSPSTGPATRCRAPTATPSRSSSGARCRARRSRRCSTISPPAAGREKCACSTSPRGAGRTTASPKTPPRSRTAVSASCSSTTSSSRPARPTEQRRSARDWLTRSWELVHPWGSGRVYPNFPDPELDDWASAYHAGNLERLARVKAAYDPDDVFRFHQSLGLNLARRAMGGRGGPSELRLGGEVGTPPARPVRGGRERSRCGFLQRQPADRADDRADIAAGRAH